MRSTRIAPLALLALIGLLLALPARGLAAAPAHVPAGPSDSAEVAEFLDTFFSRQLEEEHIAGAAVVVVRDGELLAARGYGYADLARRTPVDPARTIFATGSTGKLFTWIAVMQQVERGTLDLDADIAGYLDDLDPQVPPTYAEPITLRHLLSHTAGFDNLPGIFSTSERELVSAGLYLSAHTPARVRPPGTLAAYSNYGAALAGYLVEKRLHQPFALYVEEQILAPLAMRHTTLRQPLPAELAAQASLGYRYADGALQLVPERYVRLSAAGESHATAGDMAHLLIALLQHGRYGAARLFSESTGRQMQGQLFAHDPRVSGMAYGMAEASLNGQRLLKHNGALPDSFNSIVALLPEHGVGIYASYNSNGTFAHGERLLQAFMDRYYPAAPLPPTPIADAPLVATRMAGTYRAGNSFATSFAKLMALIPGGSYADIRLAADADGSVTSTGLGPQPLRWVPVAPDVLRLADGRQDSYGDLVFGADAQGRLGRLYIQQNAFRGYERVPWHATGEFSLGLLGLCALGLLSTLTWPAAALLRRGAAPLPRTIRTVRWLLGLAATLGLLFMPAFALSMPEAVLSGATPALRIALSLPLLVGALLAGAGLLAAHTWPTPAWGRAARAHTLLVLLAGAGYLWLLHSWNLLGFHLG